MRLTHAFGAALVTLMLAAALARASVAIPAPEQGPAQGSQTASSQAPAASTPASALGRPLRLGTTTLAPYSWAMKGPKPYGPAVWLASGVAESLKLPLEWRTYDLDGLYEALRRGEIDLAVTGLPIVAPGDEPFSYSQPWDSSGFSVAFHLRPHRRIGSTLQHILTGEFLMWFGVLFGCMLCFGALMALAERRRNSEHFGGPRGIAEGVWWSIVTMSTVGYGDRVPRTVAGRVIAGTWMIAALVLVTIIAGVLSSALTTSRIAGYMAVERDLRAVRVGIVDRRADVDMARNLGISPAVYDTPQLALAALEAHEIDALLYPTTALHALVRLSNDPSLTVMPQELSRGFVAFGVSSSLPASLLRDINSQIVRLTASPEWVLQSADLGDDEGIAP